MSQDLYGGILMMVAIIIDDYYQAIDVYEPHQVMDVQ